MRGRNPENPSDRRSGIELAQRIELRDVGISNCITTVQKDSLYLGKVVGMEEEIKTIEDYLYTGKDGEQYGIFKLSPRECGRLMGVLDSDIDKMLAVNSNSQCYKQFGNSIVVPVLCAIFSQLHIQDITPWNIRSETEIDELLQVVGK